MRDLGIVMNDNLTTNADDRIFNSMSKSVTGRDLTELFFENPLPIEQSKPVVDFSNWSKMYDVKDNQVPTNTATVSNEMITTPLIQTEVPVKKMDEPFNFDNWLKELNGTSTSEVKPLPNGEGIITPVIPPTETVVPTVNPFEEIMIKTYTVLGQAALDKGYNPDEVVEFSKNITPNHVIEMFELMQYQKQNANKKPIPSASIVGDISDYTPVRSSDVRLVGFGAKNVIV
jgi:hypothetical protein